MGLAGDDHPALARTAELWTAAASAIEKKVAGCLPAPAADVVLDSIGAAIGIQSGDSLPNPADPIGFARCILNQAGDLYAGVSQIGDNSIAAIDELSHANYLRRLDEAITGEEYVVRYLSESGLAASLHHGTVRGYATTTLSTSSRTVAQGAQILSDWGVPRYAAVIPVDKLRGYRLAEDRASAGSFGRIRIRKPGPVSVSRDAF